ncbi:MAG: hypothetical protein IJ574_00020 [Bacilli bacterium]|nr:hypothetical protein [Bacilli bacterium]
MNFNKNCCGRGPRNTLFSVIAIMVLSVLIFYQVILTLILPFRTHIFILLVEVALLFFFIYRVVWPY